MTVLRVSTQAQLNAAITAARGGDTILLASGTYDQLLMNTAKAGQGHVNFQQKVTIASADPGRPAVINEMLLRGAGNVELRDLKFDYVPSKSGDKPFWLQNTRKITLNDVEIEGHVSGAYGTGIGLRVDGSQDFSLLNSEVSNFRTGLNVTSNTNVVISGNEFRAMSFDAMLLGGITRATISGNDFRAMKSPAGVKHKDMIQFFNGGGEAPSRDITIRDNVIDNPEQSHAIFFGNAMSKAGNLSAYYRNIVIEDNYIRSAHTHGITMDHGAEVRIRNNTLVQNPDQGNNDAINIPLINVSTLSTQVTIQGNRVASVPDAQNATWSVSGNVTGTRNLLHWDGDYRSSRSAAASSLAFEAPEAGDGPQSGSETFRIGGAQLDREIELDFAQGDTIVFTGLDRGTFVDKRGGNPVEIAGDGRSATVDSIVDLQELVRQSPAITATTERAGDRLILRIEQDDGTAKLEFEGLGAAFRAAEPDLF